MQGKLSESNVLSWIASQKYFFSELEWKSIARECFQAGNLAIVKWVIENGIVSREDIAKCTKHLGSNLYSNLDLFKMIDTLYALTLAEIDVAEALLVICRSGNVEDVSWLCHRFSISHSIVQQTLIKMCSSGNFEMAIALTDLFGFSFDHKMKMFEEICHCGNQKFAEWFQANFTLGDVKNSSALLCACKSGSLSLVKWLVKRFEINVDSFQHPAYQTACRCGDLKIAFWFSRHW